MRTFVGRRIYGYTSQIEVRAEVSCQKQLRKMGVAKRYPSTLCCAVGCWVSPRSTRPTNYLDVERSSQPLRNKSWR